MMKRSLAVFLWLIAITSVACRTDLPKPSVDAGATQPHKLGSIVIPQQAGDFWVSETAATPFAIKDTGGVTRDTFETAHGRFTAGGGGSDFKTIIGPEPGAETAAAALWLLGNATAASTTNYTINGDGAIIGINTPSSTGSIGFFAANATQLGAFDANAKRFYAGGGSSSAPLIVDWATTNQTQFQAGTAQTSIVFATAQVGATIYFRPDFASNLVQMAGGTQGGIALGANLATAGHIRTPNGFLWKARNAANSADATVVAWDTSNNMTFGDGTNSSLTTVAGFGVQLNSNDTYINAATVHVRSAAATEYITLTPAATAQIQFNTTNTTAGQIGWTAAASGAGNNTTISGNDAGGTNNGGDITLAGGRAAGAGTFDGALMMSNLPLGPGLTTFTPTNGTNNLNLSQSDTNVLVLAAGATGAITINYARAVTKKTCAWIRNNTTQTATIGFNGTNSATTLATLTGGMYCADGAALQRIF